jgi:hypothetical protein
LKVVAISATHPLLHKEEKKKKKTEKQIRQ